MAEPEKVRCVWGVSCGTAEDSSVCGRPAAGIVAVKDHGRVYKLAVCSRHRQVLIAETAPV